LGEWPSPSGRPRRSAWETYGARIAGERSIERAAHIATAYSRLDDLAWLAQKGSLDAGDDWTSPLREIRLGLYEAGRLGGMTDRQLEANGVLDADVRKLRLERAEAIRSSRRRPR
jgi:hypothetical protein